MPFKIKNKLLLPLWLSPAYRGGSRRHTGEVDTHGEVQDHHKENQEVHLVPGRLISQNEM